MTMTSCYTNRLKRTMRPTGRDPQRITYDDPAPVDHVAQGLRENPDAAPTWYPEGFAMDRVIREIFKLHGWGK